MAPGQSILVSPDGRSITSAARAWPATERSRRIARHWEVLLTKTSVAQALVVSLLFATLFAARQASAQSPLSLSEAIAIARSRNPDVGSAAAAEREAAERVTQVRGGYFPRVDVAESWQRGNHPAFVFSSLLAQRQFTAADFALDALNHPAPSDNFRTVVSVEQSLFDRAETAAITAADRPHQIADVHLVLADLYRRRMNEPAAAQQLDLYRKEASKRPQ